MALVPKFCKASLVSFKHPGGSCVLPAAPLLDNLQAHVLASVLASCLSRPPCPTPPHRTPLSRSWTVPPHLAPLASFLASLSLRQPRGGVSNTSDPPTCLRPPAPFSPLLLAWAGTVVLQMTRRPPPSMSMLLHIWICFSFYDFWPVLPILGTWPQHLLQAALLGPQTGLRTLCPPTAPGDALGSGSDDAV